MNFFLYKFIKKGITKNIENLINTRAIETKGN